MTMKPELQNTIDALVVDLKPVGVIRRSVGLAWLALAAVATLALVAGTMGWRDDILAGRFEPLFLMSSGLLLVLGAAAATTAITMAGPQVGARHDGWRWSVAMAALLPATALFLLLTGNAAVPAEWISASDRDCLMRGLGWGTISIAAMTLWLRRGAPAAPERAGMLVGLASGAIGMFAFAFHCPLDELYHVGVWHAAPVVAGAIIGRLVIPPLIRW